MRPLFILMLIVSFAFTSCATRVVHTSSPKKVVVVKRPPKQHKVVVVSGQRYYVWSGNYYKKTGRGYVLVRI